MDHVTKNSRLNCALKDIGPKAVSGDTASKEMFTQIYINNLNTCEIIDKYCIEHDPCNNSKSFICDIYIVGINYTLEADNVYVLTVEVKNSLGNISYTWDIDETKWEIVEGDINSETIKLRPVAIVRSQKVGLTVVDEAGCNDSHEEDISICEDCRIEEIDLLLVPTDCWFKQNGKYYFPITMENNCDKDVDFLEKIVNVTIFSTQISVVKIDEDWVIEANSLEEFRAAICQKVIIVDVEGNTYRYTLSDGSLKYLFNCKTNGLPNYAGVFDIAFTDNKLYVMENAGLMRVTRHDVDWVANTLTNPISNQLPVVPGAVYNYHPSLCAIDDDKYMTVYQTNPTIHDIVEVDINTGIRTVIVPTNIYSNQVSRDIIKEGDNIYVITSGSQNALEVYSYINSTLIASYVLNFTPMPSGLSVSNGILYVLSETGEFYIYDPSNNTLTLNNTIVNHGGHSWQGMAEGASDSNTIPSSIIMEIEYTYCGTTESAQKEVIAPCSSETCCDECEPEIEITTNPCYTIEGNKNRLNIDVLLSGCTEEQVGLLDINNMVIRDQFDNDLPLNKGVSGQWYILSNSNNFSDLTYEYTYTSCMESKVVTGEFGGIIPMCCETCGDNMIWNIAPYDTCIEIYVDGGGSKWWQIEGIASMNCPTNPNFALVKEFTIQLQSTSATVGFIKHEGGKQYFRFYDSVDFTTICNQPLLVQHSITECGIKQEYMTTFILSCDLEECEPCYKCEDLNMIDYELNIEELCFSTNSDGDEEALLPNDVLCGNERIEKFTISIASNTTGCNFSVKQENGLWYLVNSGNCTEIASGKLVLRICWEKCNEVLPS